MLLGQLPGKQDSMMQISVDLILHNIFVLAKPGQVLWNTHIQSHHFSKKPGTKTLKIKTVDNFRDMMLISIKRIADFRNNVLV